MNKLKHQWLIVADAFDTEPDKRTPFQHDITRNGLCYAITSTTGHCFSTDHGGYRFIMRWMRANGIMADYIGLDPDDDESYDRRRIDLIRRDVAILFAMLPENELIAQSEEWDGRPISKRLT